MELLTILPLSFKVINKYALRYYLRWEPTPQSNLNIRLDYKDIKKVLKSEKFLSCQLKPENIHGGLNISREPLVF